MKLKFRPEPHAETDPPRFGPASAVLVTLGAFFGSQLLAGLIAGLFIALTNRSADDAERLLTDSTLGRFAFFVLVQSITAGLIFWFMKRRNISLSSIGLGRLPKGSDFGYALVTFGIYFVLAAMVLAIVNYVLPVVDLEQKQQIGFENATSPAALSLVFITLVILPPLVEEIMIRGFLYSGLRRRFTKLVAALVASLIFAAAHLQLGTGVPPLYVAAVDTFVLSMVLIILRERTGSLWSGIFVHALKNGLAFTVLFVR